MEKIIKNVPVYVEQSVEREFFVTTDGTEFEREDDALFHEHLNDLEEIDLGELLPNLNQTIRLVKFENEKQIEFYERKHSGGKDDNTYNSWVSCVDKFVGLPKWMVCYYELVNYYGDDYSAKYYTLDEFKENLNEIMQTIKDLN